MEFRKIFDTIPEQFDKYRPRYSPELFASLIEYAEIGEGKTVLELGPGTGQATDPILGTGCDYNAIELGEHLYEKMKQKYGHYPNFHIVNDDFITHDFGGRKFDMIYSAATIQWIPEEIAFSKTFDLLKPGGTLAMIRCAVTTRRRMKLFTPKFKRFIPHTISLKRPTRTDRSNTQTRRITATLILKSASFSARANSMRTNTLPTAAHIAITSSSPSSTRQSFSKDSAPPYSREETR